MSILALTSDTLIGTPAAGNIEYNGQFFGTDSNASRAQLQRIVLSTTVASTSGTSIDFTGIPAWVKKITVMFQGVSTNSSSLWLLQLGTSSGVTITGYLGRVRDLGSVTSAYSAGFTLLTDSSAGAILHGVIQVVTLGSNNFAMSGILSRSDGANQYISGGSIALGGVLDRVRLTTVNGTDVFDAGSINILYEG
jgi:hypothetical protein